ncbi:serine protease [Streptomyces spiroverticillatus]|uniref:Serine protease n=1 Tax=Streptomyces finlayi TaxID=67296 RepID=A0A918WZ68_9ACTN|nr:serine protease [Streptomyces finlayi]GHA13711.1 serine protease [Streptomyces spiroverticillatus]GHC97798.1 serine protease [Streptomyces finlayi]
MRKPYLGALLALSLLGAGAAPAIAATSQDGAATAAAKHRPKPVDFAGTVALSNCSGSVVRMPQSRPGDPALILSNGHCITEQDMPGAGEVVLNLPSTRTFALLNGKAEKVGTLTASKLAYATMTDTDISLYQLTESYAQIQKKYGIKALELNTEHPRQGRAITVVSGYWKKTYGCNVDGFVHRLKEGEWTWKDSLRYTSACQTIGGTSGSPVIDNRTGKVVAVNNTGNEDGERCTLNNPCEVDKRGKVTVRQGINYAQQTYGIARCIARNSQVDLDRHGCRLPEPARK